VDTQLIEAARTGDMETALRLLEVGVAVNGWGFQSPLLVAAANGHFDVACVLLLHGADPKACNANDQTALHLASERGHLEVLNLLLFDPEADPDRRADCGFTALHMAARNGHATVVRRLLAAGANARAVDLDYMTPRSRSATSRCRPSPRESRRECRCAHGLGRYSPTPGGATQVVDRRHQAASRSCP
jgi:Ankyrin repeats (3 copies)